ncbi:unnamed protein product [Hydatigera taeniaeformis]|uniref:WKF domain-containing protein n=1 Tax=Hydatigena taeniaeformis TaxID=6205 RepID=A0A0R3WQX6_HYDTA|nr:unnamed protein product [Hydatigera taeniaeformis]
MAAPALDAYGVFITVLMESINRRRGGEGGGWKQIEFRCGNLQALGREPTDITYNCEMTIEEISKSSKRHKELPKFSEDGQATGKGSQSSGQKRRAKFTEQSNSQVDASKSPKKRKKSLEVATDSVQEGQEVLKWRPKAESAFEEPKKISAVVGKLKLPKKSVKFADELVTSNSQSKHKPIVSILKVSSPFTKALSESSVDPPSVEVEKTNDADVKGAKTKSKKPRKSKNALKRIKWVKRHRKKILSRRKRRANRELARSRPQRDVQQHLAEAVEYLNAWYSSPETWKYKKVAQLTLIKHAFNPALVSFP